MVAAEKNLSKERDFVKTKRDDLLRDYANKYLLVSGEQVMGSFDTYEAAATEGVRLFTAEGQFLVQHMVPQEPFNFVMEARL